MIAVFYRPKHAKPSQTRRRLGTAAGVAVLATALTAGPALADPDFGPGHGTQSGPHDPNAKCHPPGQTVEEPGCKE